MYLMFCMEKIQRGVEAQTGIPVGQVLSGERSGHVGGGEAVGHAALCGRIVFDVAGFCIPATQCSSLRGSSSLSSS
jgi:hypothetical protein